MPRGIVGRSRDALDLRHCRQMERVRLLPKGR
jgi:hypothetical protein